MNTNKLKRYELETRELKRLICDSWLNEKSDLCCKEESEKESEEGGKGRREGREERGRREGGESVRVSE